MRDTDRDLTLRHPGASDSGIDTVADLSGKIVAVGRQRLAAGDADPVELSGGQGSRRTTTSRSSVFDVLVGKHGDHIGGERDAVRALVRGEADAACIIDANHLAFAREGTHPIGRRRESSPRRRPTITATSPCSTALPRNRSHVSASCCWACRTPTPRSARCSISKA